MSEVTKELEWVDPLDMIVMLKRDINKLQAQLTEANRRGEELLLAIHTAIHFIALKSDSDVERILLQAVATATSKRGNT